MRNLSDKYQESQDPDAGDDIYEEIRLENLQYE